MKFAVTVHSQLISTVIYHFSIYYYYRKTSNKILVSNKRRGF